ncbi:MAG TPA: PAS domain S-box protein, partial [Acidimicrobiales bacterium]|nr:PAS domain S-box protein [Acidimicrobiales bacterium]
MSDAQHETLGRQRTHAVLVLAFAVVVTAWAMTIVAPGGVTLLELLGGVLFVAGSTVAVRTVLQLDRRRSESLRRALAQTEARARLLFEASTEPMWVYELETLRITDVNDAAARLLGHERERMLDMSATELHADASPRELRAGIGGGEHRARKADGTTIFTDLTVTAVHHAGRPARLCMVRDLTPMRATEARTKAIVDNAADAILTIDLDGRIETANPAASLMFDRDDLV